MAYTTAVTGLTAQGIDAFTGLCYSNKDQVKTSFFEF